ncbi:hypothetical protein [Solibaculum intestinale]|uniref:hypothetical protein n=1 Tax=Solibaculum intestinale TaxID=3133165 RepID=UPI0032C193C4
MIAWQSPLLWIRSGEKTAPLKGMRRKGQSDEKKGEFREKDMVEKADAKWYDKCSEFPAGRGTERK